MNVTWGYDVTAENYDDRPVAGQACLYVTGSADVKATAAMLKANPDAVLIDQAPTLADTDFGADVFDCEAGAIGIGTVGAVVRGAIACRRGKGRQPLVYASLDILPGVCAAMDEDGITYGEAGLFVADWSTGAAAAAAKVGTVLHGYQVRAWQVSNESCYDTDIFDPAWLAGDSAIAQVPPGQWKDGKGWTWKNAIIIGMGLDGKMYAFAYDPASGAWAKGVA